jgi:hypothetical protein
LGESATTGKSSVVREFIKPMRKNTMTNTNGQIAIYQTEDGQMHLDVRFELDSVWLTQRQMSEVFDTTPENILMHLRNIFRDAELDESSTTKDFLVVRTEGNRRVERNLKHYNLDAITSVGYRVNSKKGTQFRIWASNILKQYLIQGYALNEEKLKAQQEKLNDLKRTIALSSRLFQIEKLSASQSQGILAILEKYSHALTVLDDYDHQRLQIEGSQVLAHPKISYDEAIGQIRLWRHQENLSALKSLLI